tara:strand:- start:1665 stop:2384 length:720 start_codon:yes stop_codon:yes gene_type:complete
MPYGSNDGYGRQQLRDRPSTNLTAIGAQHTSGAHMQSLLTWGEEGKSSSGSVGGGGGAMWGSSPQDTVFGGSTGFGAMEPPMERAHAATVPAPPGASRQALLSALEQANATIRQLSQEQRGGFGSGSDLTLLDKCENLEAEQRELVRAVDTLQRENGALRRERDRQAAELRAQTAEASQLREALQRVERDREQRALSIERSAALERSAKEQSRLSRTLSKPFARFAGGGGGAAVHEAAL